MFKLLVPLLVLSLTGRVFAGQIVVPHDQPHLAAAIAAASHDDVIVVRTSADQNVSGAPIVIDRAITIIGDPVCNISLFGTTGGLQLAGPGTGEVVLSGLRIYYTATDSNGIPSLSGTGFDAVRLIGCDIQHKNLQPTGLITKSFAAVSLPKVKQLTVIDSVLLGGPAGSDDCSDVSFYINGQDGIFAPNSSVLIVDSTVTGGRGGLAFESTYKTCPASLATWGGKGGNGVRAAEVHAWNSVVFGGAGVTWLSFDSGLCNVGSVTTCGTQPDGAAFVVSGPLANNPCSRLIQPTAEIPLGGSWSLVWDPTKPGCLPLGTGCAGSCTGHLFLSFEHPIDPFLFQGSWVFLDPNASWLLTSFPSDLPQLWSYPVPISASLIGVPISAQVLLSNGELSGPTQGLLVP